MEHTCILAMTILSKSIHYSTTPIAKKQFCDNEDKTVLIVLDGKYIFIPKRLDCTFLRQSYNNHRPLVKPMVVVGPLPIMTLQ